MFLTICAVFRFRGLFRCTSSYVLQAKLEYLHTPFLKSILTLIFVSGVWLSLAFSHCFLYYLQMEAGCVVRGSFECFFELFLSGFDAVFGLIS